MGGHSSPFGNIRDSLLDTLNTEICTSLFHFIVSFDTKIFCRPNKIQQKRADLCWNQTLVSATITRLFGAREAWTWFSGFDVKNYKLVIFGHKRTFALRTGVKKRTMVYVRKGCLARPAAELGIPFVPAILLCLKN